MSNATPTRLAVIGGFLGAGKTTAILDIARIMVENGMRIGIVTNDQGSELVDTRFLSETGLPVLEVAGGCFCCNFKEFSAKLEQLADAERPDLILAEPVGSCTDLIATIFRPLQHQLTRKFTLSPLSIIADPGRVRKLMLEPESSPFPNEINYLFRKQLEEADLILLNKVDTLTTEEETSLLRFLGSRLPWVEILPVSAKTGRGIPAWADKITGLQAGEGRALAIDYDTYAAAEAALGWLNSSALLTGTKPLGINRMIREFLGELRREMHEEKLEITHLKVYGVSESDWVKASLTSTDGPIELNREMTSRPTQINLIINARVLVDPGRLRQLVATNLERIAANYKATLSDLKTESFSPARPRPTFRMAANS